MLQYQNWFVYSFHRNGIKNIKSTLKFFKSKLHDNFSLQYSYFIFVKIALYVFLHFLFFDQYISLNNFYNFLKLTPRIKKLIIRNIFLIFWVFTKERNFLTKIFSDFYHFLFISRLFFRTYEYQSFYYWRLFLFIILNTSKYRILWR